MYGSIMKCTIDNKNYIITCYIPVDKTKVVTPGQQPYEVSDIKIHPGVKPVQCASDATALTYPSIFVSVQPKQPYDLKTLNDMNETGNLNAISIEQSFPPTFTEGGQELKERDEEYLINQYYFRI